MTVHRKYLLPLLILFIISCFGTLAINYIFSLGMDEISTLLLILSFTVSTLLSLIIFVRGLPLAADLQGMHTFVATGVKFIVELFIVLIWFVVAKKTSVNYILLFFVLYLAFSLFLVIVILKTLKKKSL